VHLFFPKINESSCSAKVTFASSNFKTWPTEKFSELINRISKKGYSLIVTGIDADYPQSVIFNNTLNVYNFVGKTKLPELASLIQHSLLVISNDSSAVHLAAYFGVESICIMWGGSFGRFLPYPSKIQNCKKLPTIVSNRKFCKDCTHRCNNISKDGHSSCLNNISVDDVMNHFEYILCKE